MLCRIEVFPFSGSSRNLEQCSNVRRIRRDLWPGAVYGMSFRNVYPSARFQPRENEMTVLCMSCIVFSPCLTQLPRYTPHRALITSSGCALSINGRKPRNYVGRVKTSRRRCIRRHIAMR
ncbi:uncharacterized protein LAESUDRAFT_457014 [Laetiporus sulphureus 93-53]|uniref:Uncharacterized protein n=1 Tax=Laetiporus sulphureus 93-53 TaxID=1314785 RepID=A0A165BTN5_9APHY|nr:uncharacterized protein LAESUDRAFT_457014 [Laetiporus sulphureus 93-53]KZT01630.1 hypothetical protein LAESUDRAFT_457014 [Laetiporus sulphureus 93-53]